MRPSSKGRRARKDRRGGRVLAWVAVVLLLGAITGGVVGVMIADQPVVQRVLNRTPKAAPAPKTDTVEKETTPASCLIALETLDGALATLAGARQQLMQGDVARASGDQSAATQAYAEVDTALRNVEVETTKQPLRQAMDDCKARAPLGASSPPPATPSPTLGR